MIQIKNKSLAKIQALKDYNKLDYKFIVNSNPISLLHKHMFLFHFCPYTRQI